MASAGSLLSPTQSAGVSRAATAEKLFKILDPNNTGNIKKSDFLELYSMLGRGGGMGAPEPDSFGISPTTYSISATRYNISEESYVAPDRFLETSSASIVHAAIVFSSFDGDRSNTISRSEFMVGLGAGPLPTPADPVVDGSGQPTSGSGKITDNTSVATGSIGTSPDGTSGAPSSPSDALVADATSRADHALAFFDPTGKGYFELADVAAAFTAHPELGDVAKAAETLVAWDDNRDGKVTRDELISGYTTMNLADALMNQLDPAGMGYIETRLIDSVSVPAFPNAAKVIAGWDSNGDGQVTRQEIVDGFHALNSPSNATNAPSEPNSAALFAQYDSNKDGSLDLAEIATATGSANTVDASQTLATWDVNSDGTVSQQEFTDGFNLIKQATGIIAQYDTAGKGYFDEADLQAAIASDPASNNAASASDLMKFWDSNGDGKVTVPEVLTGLARGGSAAAVAPVASAGGDPASNGFPDVSGLLSDNGYSTIVA